MNFNTLDLNLLRVLDAVLRERSTVRAGQRIGLSQPAVSAALGRLRHALGDELLVRRGSGLEPTDYGRAIAVPLRETLDRMEEVLVGPKRFDPMEAEDSFRISGSDFFADMLMPQLAETLGRRAPGMRVQLVDLVPDSYVDTLERYEVDLALIPMMDMPDWVECRPVFRSSFSAIARKGHPRLARAGLEPGGTMPLDLFCDLPHVLFSPEGKLKAMGDRALALVGRERQVVMTMPVFFGVYKAVSRSDLIALVPTQLAEYVADDYGLDIYEPPMLVPPALIVMIWHKRSTANPAHRWLRGVIAEILEPLDQGEEPIDRP